MTHRRGRTHISTANIQVRQVFIVRTTDTVFGGKLTAPAFTLAVPNDESAIVAFSGSAMVCTLSPRLQCRVTLPRLMRSQFSSEDTVTWVLPGSPLFSAGVYFRSRIRSRYHDSISACSPFASSAQFNFERS